MSQNCRKIQRANHEAAKAAIQFILGSVFIGACYFFLGVLLSQI